MSSKKDKQYFFEVQLNWLEGTRAVLSAYDASGSLHIATSPHFGGEGKPWTPEHLFLSSVSGGFMTTYLGFAKSFDLYISHLECNIIGQVELMNGKLTFTNINLYPKIYIANETLREKANLALENTHRNCLVCNSVNGAIFYHSEVFVDIHPGLKIESSPVHKSNFSMEEAREIGDHLGINFSKFSINEFRRGLEVELEHGKIMSETNITNDNKYITGKIAWAHLHEIPDYYTRLERMEKEAEQAKYLN